MRLSDFILQNMESILQAWEDFARTIETPLPDLDAAGLRNHAEAILRTVAKDMQKPQSAIQQLEKSRGERSAPPDTTAAQRHAVTRLDAGFTLDQVVAEFRALRASVIRLWLPLQMTGESHDVDDMVRFNEAIDQALSESITSYGVAVETTRKLILGVLGHDLRTPLAAALLGAEVLSRKNRSSQREQRVARQVATSVARAKEIVTDLLDLARANLGSGIPVQKASVDLFPLCLTLVEEIRLSQPGVTVIFQGTEMAEGQFDRSRMEQVFSNLIANAYHHGDHSKPITVTLSKAQREVGFSVHNMGKPIPPEVLPYLFDPEGRYSRLTSEQHQASGGLGLGLFIVEEIVTRHGGTIHVESSQATGTTFSISLPTD